MFRNLLIGAMAALLLGAGAFSQERGEKPEMFLKGISKARYTLAEGVMRAQVKVPGRVLAAKVDVEKGKKGIEVTYEVYILRKGKIYKVEVDGISGKIKEIKKKGKLFGEEKEEKGKEAEHRGKRRSKERGEREEEEEENERAEHRGKEKTKSKGKSRKGRGKSRRRRL